MFADTVNPPNVATNCAKPVQADPAVTVWSNVNDVVFVDTGVASRVVILNATDPFCPDPEPPPEIVLLAMTVVVVPLNC